jgi:hypothetical protein
MNKEKVKDQLHELHIELAYIRGMLENVSNQMQELRESVREPPKQNQMLRVSDRTCIESPETKEYYEAVTARLGFSGGTATTQGPTH